MSHYNGVDIGMWHRGEMSSRQLIVLTDGMPEESWYKCSVTALLKDLEEDEERRQRRAVHNFINAQLTGQNIGV